jgi:VIT1/CCC1 family predicted Fe2+/Mn2+ transporter
MPSLHAALVEGLPAPPAPAPPHPHAHYSHRAPWLRAAVLGAMDGLGSIASLMLGVQGGAADRHTVLLAGVAGAVAGALSMGVSEFVSVASQRDAQRADVRAEADEQAKGPAAAAAEQAELARIYQARGLDAELAARVAAQLSAHDAVAAHARDELGLDTSALANPVLAAGAGAGAFALGAVPPLLAAGLARSAAARVAACLATTTAGFLAAGATAAALGGSNKAVGAARVVLGGWLELGVTYAVGRAIAAAA